ncbi:sulfatase-like hydrolase/transferase [Parapedobacter sp. SGR-10]|nr:sulfatase-like hydrolase/transferase [Parapedobacter sp. SGR-10]
MANLCVGAGAFQTQATERPNILWITIEDTSPQFVGCYGNKVVSTPNIDRLAREGVRFTQAFSTNTVCSPSRTSIITGVPTWKAGTGNHRSKYPVPDFMKGFPYYLQQVGYYTTNTAKTDYNVANEKAYIQEAWDESSGHAGWWNRSPGQPFFAVFNFDDSHQSRTMTWPYDQYQQEVLKQLSSEEHVLDNAFEVPPIYRDSPEMRKQLARVYNSLNLTDKKIGKLLERLEADELTDSTIIFFFADHGEGMPRGKTNGIDLGYRVPFVVWFPPMYRHLSPWGDGVVTDELVSFEDLAPTLISMCGGKVPEYMKGRVLIGKNRDKPVEYLMLASDRSDNGPDMVRTITDGRYVYSRNYMAYMPELRYINYMEIGEIKQQIRNDFRLGKLNRLQESFFEPRPAEFLFDTKNDPWEMRNLAGDVGHSIRLQRMSAELERRMIEGRDVMLLPEFEIAKLAESGQSPFLFRTDEKKFPLKSIYEAAALSGKRSPEVVKQQIKMLTDSNNVVRYWAALGLMCQSQQSLASYRKVLSQALQDTYPPVAITAAAIGWNCFSDKSAATTLIRYAHADNGQLALLSLNYMLYVKNREAFVQALEKMNQQDIQDKNIRWAIEDFLESVKKSKG